MDAFVGLALVLALFVLLLSFLLGLHNVVHQVVNALSIHLLFRVVIFGGLSLVFARLLSLLVYSLLVRVSLMGPCSRVKVVFRAVFGQAAAVALAAVVLHLPLVVFERDAVLEVLLAGHTVVVCIGLGTALIDAPRCLPTHLLLLGLLLVLALKLLLLLHEVRLSVLV